jgi:Fur family ferric uptake transcriptional regulator
MHITPDHLIDALREQDLRITGARRAVCAVVAERHGQHLTAARILEDVRTEKAIKVDRSTVYRTLDALEESGLLVHSHLGPGPAVYHLAAEADHQHVVCTKCGAAVSIPAESLEGWIITLRETTGYEIDSNHFAVTGFCAECAARRVSAE